MKFRECRFLKDWVLPLLLFLLVDTLLFSKVLFSPGVILFWDFTFPIESDNFLSYHYPLWNDITSQNNFETIYRLAPRFPLLLLVSWGVSPALVLKAMFVMPVLLAQFSFFIFARKVIKLDRIPGLVLALLYGVSIFSLDFLYKSSLVWGYALLPLLLTCYIRSFQTRSAKLIIFSSAILLLLSVHPFVVAVSLAALTLYTIVHLSRSHLFIYVKTVGLYLLLGCYFLIPLALASNSAGALTPAGSGHYLVTDQAVDYLSSSNFFHSFLFIRDIMPTIDSYVPGERILFVPWVLCATLLLILALFALIGKRIATRDKVFYGLLFVAFLGLTGGTVGPLGGFYSALLLDLPVIGWVFRSPPKWQLYAFLPFIVLAGYFVRQHKKGLIVVLLAMVIIVLPTASQCLFEAYVPPQIPSEHGEINRALSNIDDDYRVLWYPEYVEKPVTWSSNGHIQPFDVLSSTKDTMSSRWSSPYLTLYLQSYAYDALELDSIAPMFSPLGVKYLAFHNDRTGSQGSLDARVLAQLNESDQWSLLFDSNDWFLFELDCEPQPRASVVDNLCLTNAGLEAVHWLGEQAAVTFINQDSFADLDALEHSCVIVAKEDISTDVAVQICDESVLIAPFSYTDQRDPKKSWSVASVCDLTHGEWHPYLDGNGIENWEFDYGSGLVFTEASDSLEMGFETEKAGAFNLLCRYFQNVQGSGIDLYLDGSLMETIDTRHQINSFVWDEIGPLDLDEGHHRLTMRSKGGLNAVNVFAIVPQAEYQQARAETQQLLSGKSIVYLLEAESDLCSEGTGPIESPGDQASTTQGLLLGLGSTAWRDIQVPDEADYAVALRVKGEMSITLGAETRDVSSAELGWVYLEPQCLTAGSHTIELAAHVEPQAEESFENGRNGWHSAHDTKLNVCIDSSKAATGKCSLEGEVVQQESDDWTVARSDHVQVDPGMEYQFRLYLSAQDANGVHAKVQYFDSQQEPVGSEVLLMPGQFGTFGFTEFSKFAKVPDEAAYIQILVLARSNATGTSHWWIDNVTVGPTALIDKLAVYSTNGQHETLDDMFSSRETAAEVSEYTKLSPTRRSVKVNATEPFMLSFAETYDPLWVAKVNGNEYDSVPLYSVINGFWIEETGALDITIEYKPQRWFVWGAIISIATGVGAALYLVYDWRRGRRPRHRRGEAKSRRSLFELDGTQGKPHKLPSGTRIIESRSISAPGLRSAVAALVKTVTDLAVMTCIALLAAAAIALIIEKGDLAAQIATYAFRFLGAGMVLLLVEQVCRGGGENYEDDEEVTVDG
jgi:hypothetical protein